jgi:hypothetical protein
MSIITFPGLKVLRAILPAIVLAMLVFSPLAKADDDVFTVSAVKVDVTAENAVAAREKAFAQAQSVAFMALAVKLLGDVDVATYKAPDPSVISLMIKDFEITDERLSAVRYIGTYTFRFDGDAVRNHFKLRGVHYTDVESKPVLILPFYQWGSRTILWQDDNPWLQAWSNQQEPSGQLVPVVVPLGDIRDVGDIGDNEALTYHRAGLQSMLDRYGAGEAIILMAAPGPDAGGVPATLDVLMYRTDGPGPEYVRTLKIQPDAGSSAAGLYEKAEKEVRAAIQKDWKTQTVVDPVEDNKEMTVMVHYSTMQQWVETRQAMRRVSGISEMRVKSVTAREAKVELQFSGGENRLRLALEQADMVLSPSQQPDQAAYGYDSPVVYEVYLKKYAPL